MKWNDIADKQPTRDDWYLCTVNLGCNTYCVMDLYYYTKTKKFKDNRVKNVFNDFKVLDWKGNQTYDNGLIDRTLSVTAWMEAPKPYCPGTLSQCKPIT